MPRSPLLIIFIALLGAGAPGCDEDPAEDPCAAVTCHDWATCAAGACVPLPGRCADYTDCPADGYCDAEHRCQGPIVPAPGFLAAGEGDRLRFDVQGLIHRYEELDTGAVTLAVGGFEATIDGTPEILDHYVYAFRTTIPETSTLELLAGEDVVGLAGSHLRWEHGSTYAYTYAMVLVPVADLEAMRAGETPEAAAPAALWASLRDITVTVRPFDRADLRRYCPVVQADPDDGSSRLFLDGHRNVDFSVGEDLLLWGNLALGPMVAITEANEASLCTYYLNGAPISRADYLAAIAQTEPELVCEVPEDFFAPTGPTQITLLFSGVINDPDVPMSSWIDGTGWIEAVDDATAYEVDDSYRLAYLWDGSSVPLLVVQSLGAAHEVATGHYTFYLLQFALAQSWLVDMKADGASIRAFDPVWSFASLFHYEQKIDGDLDWYKQCPVLTHDPETTAGSVLVCLDQSTDFAAGERWDVAAVVPATSDATTVQAVNGMTEPCACSSSTGAVIDCAEFDAR